MMSRIAAGVIWKLRFDSGTYADVVEVPLFNQQKKNSKRLGTEQINIKKYSIVFLSLKLQGNERKMSKLSWYKTYYNIQ